MTSSRTNGMSQSEIRDALWAGTLKLCPYRDLRSDQIDDILEGFLQRGAAPGTKFPRCMSVLALGTNYYGMPVARIEISEPGKAHTAVPAVCTYCPAYGIDCTIGAAVDYYEVLQDDPVWNADAVPDEN